MTSYLKHGYIPIEDTIPDSPHPQQQVSRSLEYYYDDYVVGQLVSLLSTYPKYRRFRCLQSFDDKTAQWRDTDPPGPADQQLKQAPDDPNPGSGVVAPSRSNTKANLRTSAGNLHYSNPVITVETGKSTIVEQRQECTDVAHWLLRRSEDFRKIIDANGTNFIRPKHKNGTWAFSPEDINPSGYYSWITETTVWQYTW